MKFLAIPDLFASFRHTRQLFSDFPASPGAHEEQKTEDKEPRIRSREKEKYQD